MSNTNSSQASDCNECDCTKDIIDEQCGECPCEPCECDGCECTGYESTSYTSEEVTDTDDEGNSEEEQEDYDDEHSCILRGKWMYDGSKTLDEMIAALQREVTLLTDLKNDGWVLEQEVQDDYAYIVKPETQ